MTEKGWNGVRAVVTGGFGFIGSNLALRLDQAGAEVRVIDSLVPGCGGNRSNLGSAIDRIAVYECDISEESLIHEALQDAQFVFNLAGEISHEHSITLPLRDLELNAVSQLRFLDQCRETCPGARIIYASSRQVYGPPEQIPVNEDHPIRPVDFNGVHKWAAESYHRLFAAIHDIATVNLRLTNIYGPRQALNIPAQGFITTFLRRAMAGEEIVIFGDGSQLRDMLFIDDTVDAFLLAALAPLDRSRHAVYNLGGPTPLALNEIARTVAHQTHLLTGAAIPLRNIPFPASRARIDIGSYFGDYRRFSEATGWNPAVSFEAGIRQTLQFLLNQSRPSLQHALDTPDGSPPSALGMLA